MIADEPLMVESNEKRTYYRLSFGPDYVGIFTTIAEFQEAVPRLWKQLEADGIVEFVEENDCRIPKSKPKYDMLGEEIEMTQAEFQAIPCIYPSWISGG